MLEVRDVVVRHGSVTAVRGVSLTVPDGEIVALLGANGAGKSTLLMAIAGALRPAGGDILLDGQTIRSLNAEQTVARGIALVPERRRILSTLTVGENLRLGATSRRDKAAVKEDSDRLFERFPILGQRQSQLAGQLSGGEQQQLAFARALMSRPRLLLCDEPSAGLSPVLTASVFELLDELRRDGVTVLLVEQYAERAVQLADRAYVMTHGRISLEGAGRGCLSDVQLRHAYLGDANGRSNEKGDRRVVTR